MQICKQDKIFSEILQEVPTNIMLVDELMLTNFMPLSRAKAVAQKSLYNYQCICKVQITKTLSGISRPGEAHLSIWLGASFYKKVVNQPFNYG